MVPVNSNIYRLMLAGWFGVILFWVAGVPEGGYQQLDVNVSIWIANFLKSSPVVSQFLFKFNSIDETYINIPIMILCQIIASLRLAKSERAQSLLKIIIIFLWVEFWILLIINPYLSKVFTLDVHIVPEVSNWMTETNRVVNDNAALISRHVFSMLFFAWYFIDKKTDNFSKAVIAICAITFALPPMLNAKHWLSDWLFSAWFAYSAVHISKLFNLETIASNFLLQKK